MIISDKHRFVFIHIPKCAGTFIRRVIQPFDSRQGQFTNRVAQHSVYKQIDYAHIPLFFLREHFSSEFEVVQDYWSFAVVRDPFSRFASSVSQHLRKYENQAIHELSQEAIRANIDKNIDYLSRQPRFQHLLPAEYIHFQKQVDYVELNGNSPVSSLYSVNAIEAMLSDVGLSVGQQMMEGSANSNTTHANLSVVFKNDLMRRAIETSRPYTNHFTKVLPEPFKQRIRNLVYIPRDQRYKDLFEADHVTAFISDYYAEDLDLYERVLEYERNKKQ